MSDPLSFILALACVKDAVITHVEASEWPAKALESFERHGLLRRISDASHVVCDQCPDGHVEIVEDLVLPDGSVRYFITCPEAGRVVLNAAQLRQWQIDAVQIARITSKTLKIDDEPETLMLHQAWRLGSITMADCPLAIVLICEVEGLGKLDMKALPGVAPKKTVLLTMGPSIQIDSSQDRFAAVVPLASVLRHLLGEFTVNRDRIETSVVDNEESTDKLVVDDKSLSVSYRGKTCKFSSRSKKLFILLKRLNRRPGQQVSFDTLRQNGDAFGEYNVEDSSIRGAITRLRKHLSKSQLKRLAQCLMTGTVDERGYAVLDLSKYDT